MLAALAVVTTLAAGFASSAGAYGGGANHDMWQIGFSINCNNPTLPSAPRGSAGPQTFFASGEMTDTFRGSKETTDFADQDAGVSAVPGHYSTSEILGFKAPPGVAIQIQVAFRPAK